MKRTWRKYLAIIFVILIALDIWTKYLIKTHVQYGTGFNVIKGLFNIVHSLNPGAAFGFLHNLHEPYRQIFFVIITIVVIIIICVLIWRETNFIMALGYTFVVAGAIGNFIDRITTGHVVDFLDFYIGTNHWPAFNIADSAITVGIIILIIKAIVTKKKTSE